MRHLTACLLGLALASCSKDTRPFKAPVKLAGKMVGAETLNLGRTAYLQYCRACHGDEGKGDGPSAPGLRPPPRNFTQGEFKFAGVLDQKLPRDEDLVRIVRANLHGTAMLGWDVPDRELNAIVQYLKTLSDAWKDDDAVGEPVVPGPDPWGAGKEAEAIARGKLLYHGFAQCLNCHPAYATPVEIDAASRQLTGQPKTDFRPAMFLPEVKPSDYTASDGKTVQLLPPDFLLNPVRSIQPGTELTDLYRILVAGVTGAAMPAWDPQVMPEKERDVWALAYYVRSLMRMRGTEQALAFKVQLATSAPHPRGPE
ncbi:MAG TPA: cytochrome c [Myxococcaceae bacterium]|nr:cytochrome c [Myxococcaceae bacterium]